MSEDLQRMFVEDAPQQVNELNNAETLSSHVLELQKLEDEIKKDEERLSQKKAQADKLSQQVIPEIMDSMKLKTMNAKKTSKNDDKKKFIIKFLNGILKILKLITSSFSFCIFS